MQTYYPQPALERAMKMQEVILRAMSGQINWIQAAEILWLSCRQMRRWKRRYEICGYDGLGEDVFKDNLTQVGRALQEVDIQQIPSYSPQARGRSERLNETLQGRIPQFLRQSI